MRRLFFSLLIVLSSCSLRSERLENPDFPKWKQNVDTYCTYLDGTKEMRLIDSNEKVYIIRDTGEDGYLVDRDSCVDEIYLLPETTKNLKGKFTRTAESRMIDFLYDAERRRQ